MTPAAKKKVDRGGAPALLLAHSWENEVDLTGWLMSEKLDGVRAYWDGATFWSRQGNEFLAPPWFIAGLPNEPLDGELFGGRKKFQRTVSIVRRQDRSKEWEELKFQIFDAPAMDAPFEERLAHVSALFEKAHGWAAAHAHRRCESVADLRAELARVEALGGEGLMLRKPGSKYEVGRSSTLLKVKSFKDDEAVVIGHLPGAGRHKGRLGALEAKLKDGTLFSVGTGFSDAEREAPPPIGTIITFRYQELSNDGVPRFPSYIGVRADPDEKAFARAPAPHAPAAGTRRFEHGTTKFWEVAIFGTALHLRFGKLGARGQTQVKQFETASEAALESERLIRAKVNAGYSAQ